MAAVTFRTISTGSPRSHGWVRRRIDKRSASLAKAGKVVEGIERNSQATSSK